MYHLRYLIYRNLIKLYIFDTVVFINMVMCMIKEYRLTCGRLLNVQGILFSDDDVMKINGKWAQIIAWGLCVVLAVALCGMVRIDRKRTAERVVQVQQQANAVQQTDSDK